MSKKSPVDSDNYYLYPEWFEGGNQSQPSTSSYSYPTLEYIWSNAVRLTRTTHSNLQDEIEYLEKNISGGGGSCNCSELQYGIDKNSTKIYYNSVNITSNANKITNLSDIKLSRDGSQPMEGELICNNGLKTDTIKARTQSILDCQSQLRVNTNLGGDGDNGLWLGSDFNIGAPAINLYPYASSANGKIFIKTPRSDGIVIPRIEIPGKEDIVDIKIRESNIIPYDDDYQDLGSGSNRWKSIYAISGNFSGTIVPDAILTNSANISDLDARVDYLEENLSTCNCSALQFGIDSNTTKIENLSVIKLSRDGSQSMTGVLKCESGVETNIIDSYSGDKVECSDDFKVDGNILGDSVDGLSLKAEEGDDVAEIELSPGSTGKILMSTPTSQGVVLPRLEIPDGTGNVDITISNAHIIPSINNWQDLGSSNKRWKDIYAVSGNFSGIVIPDNLINFGPYSAIVYKDDTGIYAKDASGNIIAQGTADVDDASVVQSAIDALDYGESLLLKAATYILDRKLTLKPINFIGEGIGWGQGTILELADNVNDDVIEIYSGGTLSHRYYYVNGRLAHLKISGNKNAQTAGNGIVLAWTQHFIIEDVEIRDVHDYAIKILRSYWTTVRNAHITQCGNGIKIGEYDSSGKYNDGDPADLYSNSNLLQTVHVDHCDIGIHIECGTLNQMNMCDTSVCNTGVLLHPVPGVEKVWKTVLIGHWFESVTTAIKAQGGGTAGCRYATIIDPIFTNVGTSYDMDADQHRVIIDAQSDTSISIPRYKRMSTGDLSVQEYLDLRRGNTYLRSRWGNTAIQASNGDDTYTTVAKITLGGFDIEKCIIRNLIRAEGIFPIVYGTQSIAAASTVYAAKFDVPSDKTLRIHIVAELYDPDNQISARVYDATDSTEIVSVDGFDDTGWSIPSGHNVEFQIINADSSNAHMGNYGFLVSFF